MRKILLVIMMVFAIAFALPADARIVTSGGTWLSVTGTSLVSTYTGGTAIFAQASEDLDATIVTTFANGTSLTSISYQVQISNDATPTANGNWEAIQTLMDSNGVTSSTHTITAQSNTTFRDHLRTQNHRDAKWTRIAVSAAGTSGAGDSATSTVYYSFSN